MGQFGRIVVEIMIHLTLVGVATIYLILAGTQRPTRSLMHSFVREHHGVLIRAHVSPWIDGNGWRCSWQRVGAVAVSA